MNTFELRQHLQALLTVTATDRTFTKYLFALANGQEQICADLMKIVQSRQRSLVPKIRESAFERFQDLRRQSEAFPPGRIFHDVIELQSTLKQLQEAFVGLESQSVTALSLQVDQFYRSFETFLRGGDDEAFARLVGESSDLFSNLMAVRRAFSTVCQALQPVELPQQDATLTIIFEHEVGYAAIVEKLAAIERAYEELCRLTGVSVVEHPLRMVKMETGKLLVCVQGEPNITDTLRALVERFALFWYRRFSVEGSVEVPERVVATQSLVNLADELSGTPFRAVADDEVEMKRSALALRREFMALLAGCPAMVVNGTALAVERPYWQQYVRESTTPRLELVPIAAPAALAASPPLASNGE